MADIGQQLLAAALGGQPSTAAAAPMGSVASALTGTPLGAIAPVLTEAVKDTPTSQTGQASSGGATRSNWSFGSGDMTIQSKSSGTASTGAKSNAQDAGGSNGSDAAAALAGLPWWGWLALAGGALLVLFLALRR